MFIENKYKKWYFSIITNASNRVNQNGYTERHHIIPKSMGGNRSKSNIVRLTGREHFICHRLLFRMVTGIDKQKMALALKMLTRLSNSVRITSRTFENIRSNASTAHSILKTGKPSPLKGKPGKPHSDETKMILAGVKRGKSNSDETNSKISKALSGRHLSEDHKSKLRKPKSAEHTMASKLAVKLLGERQIVNELRFLSRTHRIPISKGWVRKSDEWVINKIKEVTDIIESRTTQ